MNKLRAAKFEPSHRISGSLLAKLFDFNQLFIEIVFGKTDAHTWFNAFCAVEIYCQRWITLVP
jgi:hypothetical protein